MITFDDGYRDFLTNVFPIVSNLSIPTTLFVTTGYHSSPGKLFWWDELYHAVMEAKPQILRVPELGKFSLLDDTSRMESFQVLLDLTKSRPFSQAMELQKLILEQLDAPGLDGQTLLTWDEVRLLARSSIAIGAHTRWHPILTRVSRERAWEEIRGSKSDLEQQLGKALPLFAYPNGLKGDFNGTVMELLREGGFLAAFTSIKGVNVIGETNPLALKRISMDGVNSTQDLRLRLTHFYYLLRSIYSY
jgi:peptidoglycan/xylan/chitin deacetylase (PgdA/CDA1 family)